MILHKGEVTKSLNGLVLSNRYLATNHGRIWVNPFNQLRNGVETARVQGGCFLPQYANPTYGSLSVHIRDTEDETRIMQVRNIIAWAFCEKSSPECNKVIHLDYDSQNCHADNLMWVTYKEFMNHVERRKAA